MKHWSRGASSHKRVVGDVYCLAVLPYLVFDLSLIVSIEEFLWTDHWEAGSLVFLIFSIFLSKTWRKWITTGFFSKFIRISAHHAKVTMPTNCHCACTIFFAPETITTSCRNHVLHPSSRQIVEVPRVTWPCSPKLNKAQCPPLTEDPTTAWPKAACRLTQKIGITHTHTTKTTPCHNSGQSIRLWDNIFLHFPQPRLVSVQDLRLLRTPSMLSQNALLRLLSAVTTCPKS